MYQHHIMLTTVNKLIPSISMMWYDTVKQFGPENNTKPYDMNGQEVAMEYGIRDEEMAHVYTVPLNRDLTTTETLFIVQAWEHLYSDDFDVEISNQYNADAFGNSDDSSIEIDEDIKKQVVSDMSKWSHNRWVDAQISEGWRNGTHYSVTQKTHPALRNWDLLPESHRRSPQFSNQEILEWLHKNKII